MNCSPTDSTIHGILQAKTLDGSPCPPRGDLSDPGVKPASLKSPALAGRFFTTSDTWEAHTPIKILFLQMQKLKEE